MHSKVEILVFFGRPGHRPPSKNEERKMAMARSIPIFLLAMQRANTHDDPSRLLLEGRMKFDPSLLSFFVHYFQPHSGRKESDVNWHRADPQIIGLRSG